MATLAFVSDNLPGCKPFDGRLCLGSVLQDLGFPSYLSPIVLSEEEGIEKPSREIFERALLRVNDTGKRISLGECIHVGDELVW